MIDSSALTIMKGEEREKTSLFFSCDPDESFHEHERRKVPKMFEVQGPKLNVLPRNGEPLMVLPEKKTVLKVSRHFEILFVMES